MIPVLIEHQLHNVYVVKRPGVDQFLEKMGDLYEVVVFTASLSMVRLHASLRGLQNIDDPVQYADPVLDKLDVHKAVTHRLFREHCYNHKGVYVKVRCHACMTTSLTRSRAGLVATWTAD